MHLNLELLFLFADPGISDEQVRRSPSQIAGNRIGESKAASDDETSDAKETSEAKPAPSVAGRITNAGGMEASHIGNISAVGRTQAARPGTAAGGAGGAAPVSAFLYLCTSMSLCNCITFLLSQSVLGEDF